MRPIASTSSFGPERISFLVVGAQRCGTTWLDAALREHPQVHLPAEKQSYFFDRNYEKGLDWYFSRFGDAMPGHHAVGEVATGYCLPHAIPRMARDLPHVRLIMALRNPIDRAYSNYRVRFAEEGWTSFEDALEKSPDLIERGQYADQIDLILEHFPRDRLLLVLYDDLEADDRAYLKRIYEFIGVDPDFSSSMLGQRKNAAMFTRTRRVLNRIGLKPVLKALSRSAVGDLVRRAKRHHSGIEPSLEADLRTRLSVGYVESNHRLEGMLRRDLSSWQD